MNEKNLIVEIKKKKEFSELPDSIIEKVLLIKGVKGKEGKEKIKKARAILRKIFSAFLTTKILKGKIIDEEILKKHVSTKNRNYEEIYSRVLDSEKTIIDFGAGVNGFSYCFINKKIKYLGIEAIGQLVNLMNDYFRKNKFNAEAIWLDLFDLPKILKIVNKTKKPRTAFMFNIIDGLELIERNYSKKLILELAKEIDKFVLSYPTQSISKGRQFKVKRYWLLNFINENFKVIDEFEGVGEKFIIFKKI